MSHRASKITLYVRKLAGVVDTDVSYERSEAVVTHHMRKISVERIIETVGGAAVIIAQLYLSKNKLFGRVEWNRNR